VNSLGRFIERPVLEVILQAVQQEKQEQHPQNWVVAVVEEQAPPHPRHHRRSEFLFEQKEDRR